jgi:hypothetical protein
VVRFLLDQSTVAEVSAEELKEEQPAAESEKEQA